MDVLLHDFYIKPAGKFSCFLLNEMEIFEIRNKEKNKQKRKREIRKRNLNRQDTLHR